MQKCTSCYGGLKGFEKECRDAPLQPILRAPGNTATHKTHVPPGISYFQ